MIDSAVGEILRDNVLSHDKTIPRRDFIIPQQRNTISRNSGIITSICEYIITKYLIKTNKYNPYGFTTK